MITIGKDIHNPNLPFFRITSYGRQVLEKDEFIPHDPVGYLDQVHAKARDTVVEPTFTYLSEALRCFNAGCHTASVFLLGVAAEAALVQCFDTLVSTLDNEQEIKKCSQMRFVKNKHQWISAKFNSISNNERRSRFSDHTEITLTSMYNLMRQQRNDVGHPQEMPPDISREAAFVYFQLFPLIVQSVEEFGAFAKGGGLKT